MIGKNDYIYGNGRAFPTVSQPPPQINPAVLPGGTGFEAPQFKNFKDAGKFGMNQAAALYGQGPVEQFEGPGVAGFSDASMNAFQGLQNYGGPDNPFLQGFTSFGQKQNPYLDQMFNQGADQIQDRMNSMFGGAGRGGSGYHNINTGRALGEFGTNLYGGAYDNMMNRELQALGMGSNAYQNQYNQGLDYNQNLQQAGNAQDVMAQMQLDDEINRFNVDQNSGWTNLQNYQNIVNGLNPTQPQPIDRNKASSTDKLLGLGLGFAGLGGVSGIKSLF